MKTPMIEIVQQIMFMFFNLVGLIYNPGLSSSKHVQRNVLILNNLSSE